MLVLHEGLRRCKYRDSESYWTIGVGHLIDPRKGGKLPPHIAKMLAARDIDIWDDDPMPDDVIFLLLDHDIAEHRAILEKLQPWVTKLDSVRRAVLDDMVFNLGPEPFDHDGFKDWPVFLGQVARGEYIAAANNMLTTTWAKQVGSRADRLAEMMKSGKWPS